MSGLWYCVTWGKTHRARVRHGGQAIARLPPEHLAEPLGFIMKGRPEEYRGYYSDCYLLVDSRSPEFVMKFVNHFMKTSSVNQDDWLVPMYSDNPTNVFKTETDLMTFLSQEKNVEQSVYWTNKEKSEVKTAMAFYTSDGKLILGLSTETMFPDTTIEDHYFKEMKSLTGVDSGYITYEESPPYNASEFVELIKKRTPTRAK